MKTAVVALKLGYVDLNFTSCDESGAFAFFALKCSISKSSLPKKPASYSDNEWKSMPIKVK